MLKLCMLFVALCCIQKVHGYCSGKKYYSSSYGSISVNGYNRNSNCEFIIKTTSTRKWIKLSWTWFKVDGNLPTCKDYVKVYSGCNWNERQVAKFCSNNLLSSVPHNVFSPDGCMKIVLYASSYKSSSSPYSLGFRALYSSGTGSQSYLRSCSSSSYKSSSAGTIISPNWPLPYTQTNVGYFGECKWEIQSSAGYTTQVNVMDLDLTSGGRSYYSSYCPSKPYLEIDDDKYCGIKSTSIISSSHYSRDVDVKFEIARNGVGERGFAIGYLKYGSDTSNISYSHTNWGGIIGGIATSIIVVTLIVVLAIVRRGRFRRMQQQHILGTPATIGGNGAVVVNQSVGVQQPATITPSQGMYPQQSFYPTQKPPEYVEQAAPPPYNMVQPIVNGPHPDHQYPSNTQATAYPPSSQSPAYPPSSQAPAYPPSSQASS